MPWFARGLILIVLVASGCRPSDISSPGERAPVAGPALPKKVVMAIINEPVAFSANLTPTPISASANSLLPLIHPGLFTVDNAGANHPTLAEALPSIDNGLWQLLPDGRMETTHPLRVGAVWHDGAPFTPDDLVFTFNVVRDRELPAFRNRAFDFIDRVEATSATSVTIFWKQAFIDADTMFGAIARPLPKHLLQDAYTTNKVGFTDLKYWSDGFVGLGPYRLKDWSRGSHLVLAAHSGYVLGRPRIDEVEVRFILDPNALISNVLAGSVEMTNGTAIGVDQALTMREQWKGGETVINPDGWTVTYPQFIDPRPAIVGNVLFRRALLQAVDRKQLADTLMGGLVPVADSVFTPGSVEYRETEASVVRYPYDVRQAASLLEQLGFGKGPDGVYRDATGERLFLEVRAYASRDIHIKTLFPVADAWQRLGIAVDPISLSSQQANDVKEQSTFPSFLVLRQPNGLSRMVSLHSSQARLPETNYTGSNNGRYRNQELDSLIDRFQVTVPRSERTQVANQIVRHLSDQLPVLPLFYDAQPTLISNRLMNVQAGQNQTWNVQEWDVRS